MAAERSLSSPTADSKDTVETVTAEYEKYFRSVEATLANSEEYKKTQQTLNPDSLKERCKKLGCLPAFDEYRMSRLKAMLSDNFFRRSVGMDLTREFFNSINLYSLEEFNKTYRVVFEERFKQYANGDESRFKGFKLSDFEKCSEEFNPKESLCSQVLETHQKALTKEFYAYFNKDKDLESSEIKRSETRIENFKHRFGLLYLDFNESLGEVMCGRVLHFVNDIVEYPYFAKQTALSHRKTRLFSSHKSKNAPATQTMWKTLENMQRPRGNGLSRIGETIVAIREYRATLLKNKSERTLSILDAYLFPIFIPHVEHRNLTLSQRRTYQDPLIDHMQHYFDPTIPVTDLLETTATIPAVAEINNPQLIQLNACIKEILIGCLAFAAKNYDYEIFLLAPDSERLRGQDRLSFFDAIHLPLAEATCRALTAIRGDKTIPVKFRIDVVVKIIADYRNQLVVKQSKRYLNKLDAYFLKEMGLAEEEYKGNFTKHLKAYIAAKVMPPQHNLVVASSASR